MIPMFRVLASVVVLASAGFTALFERERRRGARNV
jgi:hypothetical protein